MQSWGGNIENRSSFSELLQSTFSSKDVNIATIMPTMNGFIDSAVFAYAHHHDLVIRPDDVWIAILSQFNF